MNIQYILGALTLIAASSSTALAEGESTHDSQSSTALPGLPVFELPAQASDTAGQHVSVAHARRDSRRVEHTHTAAAGVGAQALQAHPGTAHRASNAAHQKAAPSQLAAARERRAVVRARRDVAELRKAEAQERRAQAQERSAAAAEHRAAAAERQLNADALRAAAEARRANAGR